MKLTGAFDPTRTRARSKATPHSEPDARTRARIGVRTMAFSPVAWAAGLGGIAAMIAGHAYNWMEVKAAGIFGIVCLLIALLLTVGRSSFHVDLHLAEDEVRVGQRAFGRINVTNTGRRRTLPVLIELPVGKAQADFSVPTLAVNAQHEELFAIPTRKRAVIDVGPVRSVRSDPLGMIRREVVWTSVEKLYVHPNTVPLDGPASGVVRDLDGQTLRTVTDNDMNFHALREYVPGDDRRSIHWKTSARNQKLMVRQFEDTRRTHVALVLDTRSSQWLDELSFELGVSVFASFGVNTIRNAMERSAFASRDELRTTTPIQFLNATSSIELNSSTPENDLADGCAIIAREARNASLAVVVTGTNTPLAQLREEATALPPGLRVVFLRCEQGIEEKVRTHQQVSFIEVGTLEHLPKVLRSAVLN